MPINIEITRCVQENVKFSDKKYNCRRVKFVEKVMFEVVGEKTFIRTLSAT